MKRMLTLGICLIAILSVMIGSRFYCAQISCVGFSWSDNGKPITLINSGGEIFSVYADNIAIDEICKAIIDNNGTDDVRDDKVIALF